ncbi:MAG: hypothetical protein OXN90_15925 [Gemmatimonadota bacterium]|nr:hypothetical protein [Gemmatimonadota bacterium]
MSETIYLGPDDPVYEVKSIAASKKPDEEKVLVILEVENLQTKDRSTPFLFLGFPNQEGAIDLLRRVLVRLENPL